MSKDEFYEKITESISDWEFSAYNAYHKKSGIKFWIANGLLMFHYDDSKICPSMGVINRIKLWFWIGNAIREKSINSTK